VDVWRQTALQYISYFGQASLVIIIIGLIVTVLDYFNRSRWAWFVQSLIACWVFILLIVPIAGPILRGRMVFSAAEWFYIAIHQSGTARNAAEFCLIWFLMVLALLLRLKLFVWPKTELTASEYPVRRVAYLAGALVVVVACFLWINFRRYEITPAEMNSGQVMPAPPPPPTSAKN
jgi:signal transduction histidine kinase